MPRSRKRPKQWTPEQRAKRHAAEPQRRKVNLGGAAKKKAPITLAKHA